MCAKNRKITGEHWERVRDAAGWVRDKLRSGVAAVGIRGFLLIAVFGAALWGIEAARHEVGHQRGFRIYPECFKAEGPAWCAQDLANLQFPRRSYSVFDSSVTREVADVYLACPWVASVERIEKRFPNQLRVELTLREPVAFVRLPGGYHTVDAECFVLPIDYSSWDHPRQPLPVIQGVTSAAPSLGERWGDRRVAAGLSVAAALAAEPQVLHCIHIVDVSNLDGELDPLRSEITLYSRRNVRVLWGRPPDTRKFGEPSVADKLARLRRCMARPLMLAGGAQVDLRFPEEEAVARQ